jgi:hypothetical protein
MLGHTPSHPTPQDHPIVVQEFARIGQYGVSGVDLTNGGRLGRLGLGAGVKPAVARD